MMTPGLHHQSSTPAVHFISSICQTPIPPRTPVMSHQSSRQTPVVHVSQVSDSSAQYQSTPRPSLSQWAGSVPEVQSAAWPSAVCVDPSRSVQAASQDWAAIAQQWASSRNVEQPTVAARQPVTPRTPLVRTAVSPYVTTPGCGGDATPLIDER
jgi:hypothetical protein